MQECAREIGKKYKRELPKSGQDLREMVDSMNVIGKTEKEHLLRAIVSVFETELERVRNEWSNLYI